VASQRSSIAQRGASTKGGVWFAPMLGFSIGTLGGVIQSKILGAPMSHNILVGGIFGLAFGLFFARRANTPGAGLIWASAARCFFGLSRLPELMYRCSVPLLPPRC
jgi:hypothetical protein